MPRAIPSLQRLARRLFGERLDQALLEAAESWSPRKARLALWLGANPRISAPFGVAHLASRVARMGSDGVLEALLDFGADPNEGVASESGRPSAQWGPIHHAALKGRARTIRLLASRGADISAMAMPGWSPLFIAARENKAEAIAALASLGADPELSDLDTGERPVMLCARRGFSEALEALLRAGADPQPRTPEGATAMHLAAAGGFADACRLLRDFGADPAAIGPFGRTPARVAHGEKHLELAARIESWALERAAAEAPPAAESASARKRRAL